MGTNPIRGRILNSFGVSLNCLEEREPHRGTKLGTKSGGKKRDLIRFLQKKMFSGKLFLEGSEPLSTAAFSELGLQRTVTKGPLMAFLSSKPQAYFTAPPAW